MHDMVQLLKFVVIRVMVHSRVAEDQFAIKKRKGLQDSFEIMLGLRLREKNQNTQEVKKNAI